MPSISNATRSGAAVDHVATPRAQGHPRQTGRLHEPVVHRQHDRDSRRRSPPPARPRAARRRSRHVSRSSSSAQVSSITDPLPTRRRRTHRSARSTASTRTGRRSARGGSPRGTRGSPARRHDRRSAPRASGSSSSRLIAAPKPSRSCGSSMSRPCSPSTIWSTMPPTRLATTGRCFHIASTTVSPKPSARLFWVTTVAWRCSAFDDHRGLVGVVSSARTPGGRASGSTAAARATPRCSRRAPRHPRGRRSPRAPRARRA